MKKKSISKGFLNFLISFDLFAKPMNLMIKKKQVYNTLFGSLITLAIMIFVIYTLIDLLYDLFSKRSPTLNFKTEYEKDPEVL